jgi:2-dehydropantoate 2-reductase
MKILMIGAGVLGSLYAARLQTSGNQVTVLARGQRASELRQNGILLEEENSRKRTTTRVAVTEKLSPEDAYDLAIVLVRNNQLPSVLPALAENINIPAILFMVNQAAGPEALINAVGRERVLLGFPGAGGERDGEIVRYRILHGLFQRTTVGELHGSCTPRIQAIAGTLRSAGFPLAISSDMDAWLKTHVAIVSPIANAIYLANGSNYRLAHTRDGLVLALRAIREGFTVLEASGVRITPAKFHLLKWLPEPLIVWLMGVGFNTRQSELVMARHANAARDEMAALAEEFNLLVERTHVPTPAIDYLNQFANPQNNPLPEGSQRLALRWHEVWPFMVAGALLGIFAVCGFLRKKK